MFCTSCGAKLKEGSRFCTACGAKVVERMASSEDPSQGGALQVEEVPADVRGVHHGAEEPKEPDADRLSAPAKPTQKQSLASALIAFRRTTLKAVPTFVLAILAILTAAGTAYAAYRVATEVVIPAVEHLVGQDDQSEGESGGSRSGDYEMVSMTGKPKSILQIGEVLAMNPGEISSYLESQGLEAHEIKKGSTAQEDFLGFWNDEFLLYGGHANDMTVWQHRLEENFFKESIPSNLLDADLCRKLAEQGTQLKVFAGVNLLDTYHYPPSNFAGYTASALALGDKPSSVAVSGLPLTWLDEDSIQDFAKSCGLGEALMFSTGVEDLADGSGQFGGQTAAGFFSTDGEEYCWLLRQSWGGDTTFSCFPVETANQYVCDVELYSDEEWTKASYRQRAMMVAQSAVQDVNTGNGNFRLNYRTGKTELAEQSDEGGWSWIPLEDYKKQHPDAEITRFDKQVEALDATKME